MQNSLLSTSIRLRKNPEHGHCFPYLRNELVFQCSTKLATMLGKYCVLQQLWDVFIPLTFSYYDNTSCD